MSVVDYLMIANEFFLANLHFFVNIFSSFFNKIKKDVLF